MSSDPTHDDAARPLVARQLFEEYLSSLGEGEAVDIGSLCTEHPEHAAELRALGEQWEDVQTVLAEGTAPADPLLHRLLEECLDRMETEGDAAIDAICEAHPEQATALRERMDALAQLDLLAGRTPSQSSSADLSNRYADLLEQLRRRAAVESRYRVEGEVARGGMGAILRVHDDELDRELAMKVILSQDDPTTDPVSTPALDAKVLARFMDEAQVTGQLEHPGVVPVHELGLDKEGRAYFTMRLVKGRDLKEIYRLVREESGDWSEARALGVVQKACEAVAYAHAKGVTHRDLKPGNIMVGKFGEVYVMDWGLARVRGRPDRKDVRLDLSGDRSMSSLRTRRRDEAEATPDSPLVTMDGDVVGTPAYMSPEQARGEVEKVGSRSDVYSMGAMLYELLAGHAPFLIPGARMTPRTVLTEVLRGSPTPLHELRRDIPAELEAICEKAMSRDAASRYESVVHLSEDLRAFQEGRVVRAHRTGAVAEFRKWVSRNRGVAAGAAACLMLIVVLSFVAWFKAVESVKSRVESDKSRRAEVAAREAAEENANEALQERDRAEAVKEFLMTMLSSVDPAVAGSMDKELMKVVLSDAAANVDEQFADQPLLEAEMRYTVGVTYNGLGLYDEAYPHIEKSLEINRRILGDEHPDTLLVINFLAGVSLALGQLAEAEELFREALDGRRRTLGNEHPDTLSSITVLGNILREQGKFAEAEAVYRETLEVCVRSLSDEDPVVLSTNLHLGALLSDQGKFAEAEPLLREAVDGHRRVWGDEHPDTLTAMHTLGSLIRRQGKLTEAEAIYREVLDQRRQILGDDHPDTLSSISDLGVVLGSQGNFADAEPLFRQTLNWLRRTFGNEHPSTQTGMNNMGAVLQVQGKVEEAEPLFREALTWRRRTLGNDHPETLAGMSNLGVLLKQQGRFEEAEVFYREALDTGRRVLGGEHPDTLLWATNMGALLQAQGKVEDAEEVLREALEASRRVLGEEHPNTLQSIHRLSSVLQDQGRLDEAEALARELMEHAPEDDPHLADYEKLLDDILAKKGS